MNEILLNIAAALLAGFTLILILTVFVYLFVTRIPYVPSRTTELDLFLREHRPAAGKHFYDLGCGDGKVLLLAEKHGLRATGFEISPLPWLLARLKKLLKKSAITVHFRNFLKADLSGANYVYCYLFPELTENAYRLTKKQCQPGSLFICDTFRVKSEKPMLVYKNRHGKEKLFIYQI
jgi:SAM-dependent methyltransferase